MSDQKTGKPQAVIPNQRNFKGKDGTQFYIHGIIMEGDSTLYEYISSKTTCEEFKQGVEVSYTTSSNEYNGKVSYKIKPVKSAGAAGGGSKFKSFGGGNQKTPEQLRLITLQGIFGAVCTLGQGSATVDQSWDKTKEIYNKMMDLAYVPHPVEQVKAEATPVASTAQPITPNPITPTPQANSGHVVGPNDQDLPF